MAASSLPVAALGLLVNLTSVKLLHSGAEEHAHAHHSHEHQHQPREIHVSGPRSGAAHAHDAHDHNYSAAVLHVVADICTSALAIVALLAGRYLGWTWLDPVTGIVGGIVILTWGISLCRSAALDLLNVDPSVHLADGIRALVEGMDDVRVSDLRVWPLGRGARGCVMTLIADSRRDVGEYRRRVLESFRLDHLTIEVRNAGSAAQGATPEA